MLNITVIGLGAVGTAISHLLLNRSEPIHINILEPNNQRIGTLMDLVHGLPLLSGKKISVNNHSLFERSDFVFHTAGHRNELGQTRLSKVKVNAKITRSIFQNVKFRNNPFIIVVANPVDIITYQVRRIVGSHQARIFGTGTLLDSTRLSHQLNENSLTGWILGEHGETMALIKSISSTNVGNAQLEKAFEETKRAASFIRKTQSYTAYGISQCAIYLFNQLRNPMPKHLPISIGINKYYQNLLDLPKDLNLSLPVSVSSNGLRIINTPLSSSEIKALKKSGLAILSHIDP